MSNAGNVVIGASARLLSGLGYPQNINYTTGTSEDEQLNP